MRQSRRPKHDDFGDHGERSSSLYAIRSYLGCEVLAGFRTARMLEEMVDKGLEPFLVLHCGHFGAILRDVPDRNGNKTREAVYSADIDR